MDGYSLIYQYAISIAALFYLWLGSRFLMMLLRKAGGSIKIAAVVTFFIAAGTNIMYFAIVEDSMSHVYSFALVTLFLYYVYRYFQDFKGKYFIFAATLFALILLVRPTNGLILLLIPLMAWMANRESRIENRKSRIENRESRIENRESKIENRKSRIENRESKIENRESRNKKSPQLRAHFLSIRSKDYFLPFFIIGAFLAGLISFLAIES
jgi:hypothetical protein